VSGLFLFCLLKSTGPRCGKQPDAVDVIRSLCWRAIVKTFLFDGLDFSFTYRMSFC